MLRGEDGRGGKEEMVGGWMEDEEERSRKVMHYYVVANFNIRQVYKLMSVCMCVYI